MAKTLDKYRGTLLGLAIGDALGAPVEFKAPDSFPPVTDFQEGGPFELPKGCWTDDTIMALCLAQSIILCEGFDGKDQMQRYLAWYLDGYMSPTGRCFDIGGTTRQALNKYQIENVWYAGSEDPLTAGNGSIMRLAPVVLAYLDKPVFSEAVRKSSQTTHGAQTCLDACDYLAYLLRQALNGVPKDVLLATYNNQYSEELANVARGSYKEKNPPEIIGSGYVVESLEAALWAFYHGTSFSDVVLKAVNLGYDTDTTGAIAGQLAGAYYGEANIPTSWRKELFKSNLIQKVADSLFKLNNTTDLKILL